MEVVFLLSDSIFVDNTIQVDILKCTIQTTCGRKSYTQIYYTKYE